MRTRERRCERCGRVFVPKDRHRSRPHQYCGVICANDRPAAVVVFTEPPLDSPERALWDERVAMNAALLTALTSERRTT